MGLRSAIVKATTGHTVEVRPSTRHVRVLVGGEVVADTRTPLVLTETGLPDRWYIPRTDVRPDALEPSDTQSHCPYKGDAAYVTVRAGGQVVRDAAWGYDAPKKDVAAIAGHLSFYPERVTVEVDGRPLLP